MQCGIDRIEFGGVSRFGKQFPFAQNQRALSLGDPRRGVLPVGFEKREPVQIAPGER